MTLGEEGGILLVNKPHGWSSFDAVKKIRSGTGLKLGHAGTLDPLASGLLVLAAGKATKKIDEIQAGEKTYVGSFCLGGTTESHDLEHEIIPWPHQFEIPAAEQIEQAAKQLTGRLSQIPPIHSAIKIGGKRAYKMARKGVEMTIMPREIEVRQFKVECYCWPFIHFTIQCTKGTYIRALARDIGELLGTGGFLAGLCRTQVGPYKLADALPPAQVIAANKATFSPPAP